MNPETTTKQNEALPVALEKGFIRNDALKERAEIFNHPQSFLRRNGKILLRRRKFALGAIIVGMFYAMALMANFLAPYDYRTQSRTEPLAPPSSIRFQDSNGRRSLRPFVYARRLADPLNRRYVESTREAYPITVFAEGFSYKFLGLFDTNRHLFGVRNTGKAAAPRLNLLGTDELGRDRLSRLLIAARFSLLVGPLGMLLASALGILIGCVSGYGGRGLDALLMRAADVMMALPTLVIVLAARAAFPLELPPLRAAALLISIFVVVGWAEMARLARGVVRSLRQREFVIAAQSLGLSERRVLFRHILPNALRPLIVQMTVMLPAFLLTETALSFLGVGVQEPEPSWGSMLAVANDVSLLGQQPFVLLSPALAILLFVLGARLLSDGMQVE
ncbi:MAG: ABC transporter permease [Pyrinomonadaceae bacterium]|nr:ABC transporter permease [Pyrinomonadaceae bacterium]